MKRKIIRLIVISALCIFLLPRSGSAQGVTPGQADGIIAGGIAIAVVVVGVAAYLIVHHQSQSIRGCATSGPTGLELQDEGDQKTFQLVGMTTNVKSGDRVQLNGKKKKAAKGSSDHPSFLVDKLSKDYGACKAATAGL